MCLRNFMPATKARVSLKNYLLIAYWDCLSVWVKTIHGYPSDSACENKSHPKNLELADIRKKNSEISVIFIYLVKEYLNNL